MRFKVTGAGEQTPRSRFALVSSIRCLVGLLVLINLGAPGFSPNARSSTSPCTIGVRAAAFGFWTWASETRVKVYIRASDFKSEEIPYLLAPLRSWDAVWDATGSGVRLDYAGTTSAPVHCQNCLTIMRAPIFDPKQRHGSEFEAYSEHGTQIVSWASLLIDPAITNPKALTNAVAHELGHSFGLLDCYACKDRSTVMNKLKSLNASNDMEGPTACDIEQVRSGYQALRIRVGPAPTAMNIAMDDGEEPVEDDTPVVVPD